MTITQTAKRQFDHQLDEIKQQFADQHHLATNSDQEAAAKLQFIQKFDHLLLTHNTLGTDPQYQRLLQSTLSSVVTTNTSAPQLEEKQQQHIKTEEKPDEPLRGHVLRAKIRQGQQQIRERVKMYDAPIIPRTQAHNRKQSLSSLDEERDYRSELLADQIKSWRQLLPNLLRRFSKIPDPRKPEKIKHQLTTLMMFGLFAFIFRISSRREMNRELTGPVIFTHLKTLFPDIETIPHFDTVARLLERIKPHDIEQVHIDLVKQLIRNKKFKKLLIHGCLPITADGAQKLYRVEQTHYL